MTSAISAPAQDALRAAMELQQRGDFPAAESAYRAWLERFGSNPDAEHMLALTLHAAGRSDESLAWFERASAARGGAGLWSNHAAALLAAGRAAEAEALGRRATRADPRHVGAWLNLGLACELERNIGDAVAAFETVLRLAPGHIAARRALARCRLHLGEAKAALDVLRALPSGKDAAADLIRCEAQIDTREFAAASATLARLAALDATRNNAWLLQAEIAAEEGRSEEALDLLARVRNADPENRQANVKSALMRINRGDTEAGLTALRGWLDRHPEDAPAAGSYLIACNYSDEFGPAELLAEHRSLAPATDFAPAWPSGFRAASGDAKLRVGWAASAFSVGPMEIFFADVLKALPAAAPDIEHVLYALGGESTSAPASAAWAKNVRDVSRVGNTRIVDTIRADGIDILVDMVGRAAGNRLPVFAARAAPVQIGWLDAFYPSGIDAMDYLVTDPWLSPDGADANFSERLIRLPHGRLAYRPPPVAPGDAESAAIKRFVSLNRFSKLNEGVIDVWASILHALPEWTLLLKAHGRDDDLAARFHALFAAAGVDPSRVAIEGGGSYADAMAAYSRASIALDPFPFSGCSTTCDALWMGLPVVTWPRETIASRQTAAWLEMAGKSGWIANDAASYVDIAVALARDEDSRRAWRFNARDVLRPAIADSQRLAREFADALKTVARTPR